MQVRFNYNLILNPIPDYYSLNIAIHESSVNNLIVLGFIRAGAQLPALNLVDSLFKNAGYAEVVRKLKN